MSEDTRYKGETQASETSHHDTAETTSRLPLQTPGVDSLAQSERLSLLGSHSPSGCHPVENQATPGSCVQI